MNSSLQQLAKKFQQLQGKYHPKKAHYPEALKMEAVQLIREGATMSEVGRMCNLSFSLIKKWSIQQSSGPSIPVPAMFKRVEVVHQRTQQETAGFTVKTHRGLTLQFHDLKQLIQFIQCYENYS